MEFVLRYLLKSLTQHAIRARYPTTSMNSYANRIENSLRTARYALAGILITGAFVLTLLPARIPPTSDASPAQQLDGGWISYANGDAIQALALDGDPSSGSGQGTLWAGTEAGGVVRWNLADPSAGLRTSGSYTQYLYPQTGLACNDVRDVLVGGGGSIWFATCRGLSVLSPDGSWQNHTVESTGGGLPSSNTTAIATDPAGYLWVGTDQRWNGTSFEGGGLARWEWATGEWQTFTPPTSPAVVDVAVDHGGKVWVATKPFTTWIPPTDDEPGHWGRRSGGLAVWDGDSWQSYTSESDVADSITALAVDEAGNVWVGTEGNGVFAFTDRGPVHFRSGRGRLADGYISAIGFGSAGRIWIGTRAFNGNGTGVSVLYPGGSLSETSDDVWQQYTTDNGLSANLVTAIVGRGDQLWLGTNSPDGVGQGISRFDTTTFQPPLLTRQTNPSAGSGQALTGNTITAVAEAPDGRLWVGTAHNGVSVLSQDRRTWVTYTLENTDADGQSPWTGLRGNAVSGIAFDSQGRAWIGARRTIYNVRWRSFEDGGLSMFDPDQNQWSTFTQRNTDDDGREPWRGLKSDEVSAVAVDWQDRIWVGSGSLRTFTGSGVSVLDTAGTPANPSDDTWSHHDVYDKLPSLNITDIIIDRSQQRVWVAGAPYWINNVRAGGGVGRFDGTAWTRWDHSDGLVAAENEIRSLALGLDGAVWAGGWTYRGSFHWPTGTGVDAVANRFDGTSWGSSQIWEDDGYVASLFVGADGTVWAGTSKDGHGAAPATGGVKWSTDGTWTALTTANTGIAGDEIQAIAEDANGDLWFGSRRSGLSRYGENLPVEPTPPAATRTPTPTSEAPISRVHQMYLPLALAGHTGVLPPATPTPTVTPTSSAGPTATASATLLPGVTPSPTATVTPTPGVTSSPTSGPGVTPTPTATSTPSVTPTTTSTATRSTPTAPPSPTPKPPPSGGWAPVSGVPPVDLFDVFCVEAPGAPAEVWAVGEQGVILHSADGGSSWSFQDSHTDKALRSVYFVDRQIGWAAGDNGTIRHTADGGETWQVQLSPASSETLVAIAMTSPLNGWALGAGGTALRWNGSQWGVQASTSYKFTALSLSSGDDGWATTAAADTVGRVIRLTGGQWMSTASFQGLHDIHVPVAGQGWAVGSRGTVARQLEGRWEYVSRPPTGGQALYAVHSPGPDHAWVMGNAGLTFYHNGERWENKTDSRVTRHTIYALRMTADERQGWAVGEAGRDSGTILRFFAEQ
ncbi:MAG: Ycf48-like protein [Anaerolineales bacterium]|nr:Ycf48-like protein [Anaerolineales bacterium]